jgi:hypothetical protein
MLLDGQQLDLCKRYGAAFLDTPLSLNVGINRTFDLNILPLNGLRHPPQGGTSGWYFWTGEISSELDFFVPLCGDHLLDRCPVVMRFLGLPPGWRFLLAPNHEDVWFDAALLDV